MNLMNGLKFAAVASVNTAIGTIPADMNLFVTRIAHIAAGLGGVAAIGLLTYGGFTVLTSAGDPEKLMNGKEIITNALTGLALVVLAVFILEFLGVGILGLNEVDNIVK